MATFFDDFSTQTVGSAPSGYSQASGTASGSVSVVEDAGAPGGKAVRFRNVAGSRHFLSSDEFAASTGVREVALLVRTSTTWDNSIVPGPTVRLSATEQSFYLGMLFRVSETDKRLQIRRRLTGSFGRVAQETDIAFDVDVVYALRLRVDGTALSLKWWTPADLSDATADEPVSWTLTGTDSNVTTGLVGFGMEEGGFGDHYVLTFGVGTDGDTAPFPTDVAVPTGFTFTATGQTLAGSWSAVGAAATYDWVVERDDAGTWVAFDDANTASTSFELNSVDGVAFGTTYRARVRSVTAGAETSSWTAWVETSTAADLLALSGEQIEAVALSWTAATGPYDIRRDETTLIAEGLTVTTFTDDDVEAATSYTYEVREDGGAWSEPVTVAVVAGGGGVFFLKPNGGGWST